MDQIIFIFKNKIYPFDINLFNSYSSYFSNKRNNINKNVDKNSNVILLLSDYDCIDVPEASIDTFFRFFQNQDFEITNSIVISLNYLSTKFEITLLTQITEEYITNHCEELANYFLSLDIAKIQQKYNISKYEEILSKCISKLIDDERLLNLSISSLYRIFSDYFLHKKNNVENKKDIINLFFRILIKKGRDASILFSLIEIDDRDIEYFSMMLVYHFDNFDFQFINTSFFKSVVSIIRRQKDALAQQQELIQKQMFLVFANLNKVELPQNVDVITEGQYSNFSFQEITIPSTVKIIKNRAFSSCKYLTNITIPSSVQKIGSFAFMDCSLLRTINLPSSLLYIEQRSFYNCSSLVQVTIPSTLAYINEESFRKCSSLKEITLPESVKYIGPFAFADCSSLEIMNVPSSVTSIEKGTFYNCSALKLITLSSSLKKINEESFRKCSSLKEITLPESVQYIGPFAFADCSSLEIMNVPSSVTSIEKGTFYNCFSLSQLTFDDNLLKIEDDAFGNCISLAKFAIPSSLTYIGSHVFYGYSLIIESSLFKPIRLIEYNDAHNDEIQYFEKIKDFQVLLIVSKIPSHYNQLRFELIDYFSHIGVFSLKKMIFFQKIVDKYLLLTKSTDQKGINPVISWPNIKIENKIDNKTQNINLFEALIWYSQMYNILNKINSEDDLIDIILKFDDYSEISFTRKSILSECFQNEITSKSLCIIKKELPYALNAHMIVKLFNINSSLITDPQSISNIINSYINRFSCDEGEFNWIHDIVLSISSDFVIKIPKFVPYDLIFLIVNQTFNSEYKNGPLFTGVENLEFLKEVKQLMDSNFRSFCDAAQSIALIVYKVFLPNISPPQNFEELVDSFENQKDFKQFNYKIFFDVAKALDKWTEPKLIFDDISFLTSDFINDQKLLNLCPSLVFWTCKNQITTNQLVNRYKDYIPISYQIPFWLFALRIMSSQNCIEFESEFTSKTSEIIKDVTKNIVIEYLTNSMKNNNDINYNWMNILIPNPPQKIINTNIKIVYDFLYRLSSENLERVPQVLLQMICTIMKNAISYIVGFVLSDEQKFISSDLLNNDSSIQFVLSPIKYIQSECINNVKSLLHFESKPKLSMLKKYIENFDKSIQKLQIQIEIENNKIKGFMKKQIEIKNEQEKIHFKKNVQSLVKRYNEIINSILHDSRSVKINLVKELKQIQIKLQNLPEVFKNEGVELVAIAYKSLKNIEIIIRNEEDNSMAKAILRKSKCPSTIYLHPHQNICKEDNISVWDIIIEIAKVKFNFIKEEIDYDGLFKPNEYFQIPVLIFGERFLDHEFLAQIKKVYNDLNFFYEQFSNILNNNQAISESLLEFTWEIQKRVENIIENLSVKFLNCLPALSIELLLKNEINDNLHSLNTTMNSIRIFLNEYLVQISKYRFDMTFQYQYDIPIVTMRQDDRLQVPDFSNILYYNSLDLPIVYVSPEDKIKCSFEKLQCFIRPIIPSLTCDPILLSISSVISEKVTIEIDNLADHQYYKLISINEIVDNKVYQIVINPPQVTRKEPENMLLKFDLKIQAGRYETLVLPCEIKLLILPLKFRLRCLEYKLSEENQSFRLCCDKIESDKHITFEIINYYIHDHFALKADIELLDGNEAPEPEFIINKPKRFFSIFVPQINRPLRYHFMLKIALSRNLIIQIHCDFIIIPIQFSEINQIQTKISIIKLNREEEMHHCFIVSENDRSKPINAEDEVGSLEFKNENEVENIFNSTISLPNITLPDVLTIKSLNTFFLNCSNGAALLPFFIRENMIKGMNFKDLELYFAQLLKIYKQISSFSRNRSILSVNINSFINSFEKCFGKLEKYGIDFRKLNLPQRMNHIQYKFHREFIEIPDFYIPEFEKKKENEEEIKGEEVEINPHCEMYIKNMMKGQKLLIIMLCDNQAGTDISPDSFINANDSLSIKSAVGFFGIEIVLVRNYKDAICELIKQTKPGFCDYYAAWLISGHKDDSYLVDKENKYHADQFISCLIKFWENGGSVVLFANGYPFTFHVNLFLEKIVFPDNSKTQLRVGGVHKGKKFIIPDKTGKLDKAGTFYKSPLLFCKLERPPLCHNVYSIYEGESISFVPDDKSIYHPFIPFMKDSENGISGLLYSGDIRLRTGDIIIDCGFSKLFSKMDLNGTFKYVQNIAGWTGQLEYHMIGGIRPTDFRPKAIIFDLDK